MGITLILGKFNEFRLFSCYSIVSNSFYSNFKMSGFLVQNECIIIVRAIIIIIMLLYSAIVLL